MKYWLLAMSLLLPAFAQIDAWAAPTIEPGASCINSSCHSDIADRGKSHLMAAQGQSCNVCHTAPDPVQHEFQFAAPGGELCMRCHAPIVAGPNKHVPAAAGLCTTCHKLHRAEHPKQLGSPLQTLCTTCHNQLLIPGARTAHLPAAQGQCIMCHDPHSSNSNRQLKEPVPDLCFNCHDQQQQDADGSILPAVAPQYDAESLNKHPAFARGQCLLCHDPHDSENYRLQREPYPESLYTSFSTGKYFCVHCHGTKTITEPRTLSATEFRNGNLNLHYRHVNRAKGRSCGACHHHHASERDGLIIDKIPFGDRYIEIKLFEKTDTGGRCGPSCHRIMVYDRIIPANNGLMVTARTGVDASPEELRQEPIPIDGAAVYEKRCVGCHGVNAGGKIGPAIRGASADEIKQALEELPMMWALSSLGAAEIQAVADFLSTQRGAPAPSASGNAVVVDSTTQFATICAACHGADAKGGLSGMAPAITGASSQIIEQAIAKVPFMRDLSALSAAEIQAIADHLAEDSGASSVTAGGAAVTDGKTLFATRCAPCHGADANGLLGPAINGVSVEMIEQAISAVPMMKVLSALSPAEIQAAADYLSITATASSKIAEAEVLTDAIDGQAMFAERCSACHGADATGGLGGMAPGIAGASSGEIEDAIGRVPMMQGVASLTENEIEAVSRALQAKNAP